MRGRLAPARWAGQAALAAFLGVFFVWPVGAVLWRGIAPEGAVDLQAWSILAEPRTLRIIGLTVGQAALATVICVVLALPVAHVLYRLRFRGRAALRALALAPFVLPTVVVGVAFRVLLDDTPLEGSWWSIVLALVFFNLAVVVRTVGVAWEELDPSVEEQAADLYAGAFARFRLVTLPRLAPAVASAAVVAFLFSATAFGVVLILGGTRYGTIETEIWVLTAQRLDLASASALSVLQIAAVVALLFVAGRIRVRSELRSPAPGRPPAIADAPVIVMTLLVGALTALPILALVLGSLRDGDGWTLEHWASLVGLGELAGSGGAVLSVSPLAALGHSLGFAVAGTALAMLLGVGASVLLSRPVRSPRGGRLRSLLDGALMLPLGVSAVTLGFGFLIALDRPPFDLRQSAVLVPIAQALVAAPLVIRTVLPVLRGLDPALRDAAVDLGASPGRVLWTVELPIAGRSIAAAAGLAFAVCVGEFGATTFLSRPDRATLPVVIERLAGQPGPGNLGTADAAAVLLAAVVVAALLLTEPRVTPRASRSR